METKEKSDAGKDEEKRVSLDPKDEAKKEEKEEKKMKRNQMILQMI